ncbi:MAG: ABC transporter substrate-binding protein [Promethearchaeota archaeon]
MSKRSDIKFLEPAIIIVIILNVIIFGSFSYILIRNVFIGVDYFYPDLKIAQTSNPLTMDPCDSWDRTSNDMLDQVVEPLIATDLTDLSFPIVPRLAESWVWLNETCVEFTLRDNVFFHDGQKLTGEDVVWTFERINFFGNWTGTLDPTKYVQAFPHSLYKFSNGHPIFNDTLSRIWWDAHKASNPLVVRLYLNGPFAPTEGLLSYTASYIVGHESTPKDRMLSLGTDLLIGTGPFKLVGYIPNSEIRFARWERYWRTGAYWDKIAYVYYKDAVTANNAMLAGDIDYLGQGIASLKPDFEADPDITVTGDGTMEYIAGSLYWYIGFNSEIINQTWRKAMCSAFNHTNFIEHISQGTVVSANSLVPSGFPAHNQSVVGGSYNIPLARIIMQSMGYGYTNDIPWDVGSQVGEKFTAGTNESLWLSAEFIPTTNASGWTLPTGNFTFNGFNFHYKGFSNYIIDLLDQFRDDMHMIGIKTAYPDQRFQWDDPSSPKELHIFYSGWVPEYFETFTMINPLVNPASASNFGKINNSEINSLLTTVLAETDTHQRYELYKKLQYLVHDKYYYEIPLYYDKRYFVHTETLKGFPYNPMSSQYWYPTYRGY